MGIFDKFKKTSGAPKASLDKKEEKKDAGGKSDKVLADKKTVAPKVVAAKSGEIKGKTTQAYRILIKPLVTEKATHLGLLNKYVFAVNPKMNKVEVKKAIRTIYNVEPIGVNICNFSGKNVRYGQVRGKTKNWKKAIVTLKSGDKIEIYEGV